jgi:ABC-type transporter Mla MlaB component
MWKIQTISEDIATVTFSLSGRLRSDQVRDLWALLQAETRKVTFDLQEVDIVDQEMVAFLSHCAADGVKLQNCPLYIDRWIAKGRASKSNTNLPGPNE